MKVTDSDSATITAGTTTKTIDASARTKAINITGNSKDNTIQGGSGKDVIYGGAGNDSLLGNAGNDSLSGGTGADTLVGGKGNDTLTGGSGRNVFVFGEGDGKDIITDYIAGVDSIKLTSGSITSSSLSGNDVILNTGSSSTIKIKNGRNKKITVIDSEGNSTTKKYTTTKNFVEEHWFLENSEFENNNSEIACIVNPKFEINSEFRIQNSELENLQLSNSSLRITNSALIKRGNNYE